MSETVKVWVEEFKEKFGGILTSEDIISEVEGVKVAIKSGLPDDKVKLYYEYIDALNEMMPVMNHGMYFVSMCGSSFQSGVFQRNNGKSFGFEITPEMLTGEGIGGGLVVDNGTLRWSESGKNIADFGLSKSGDEDLYAKGISFDAVKATDESPILFVLCNEIKLFQGITAELKLLRLNNEFFLAALITGACAFNGVPLQRCNTANLDNAKIVKTLTSKDLFGDCSFMGKTVGDKSKIVIDYSYDALCHGKFIVRNDGSYSAQVVRSKEYVFDNTYKAMCEERLKKAKEEEKRRAEELQAKREADRKAAEEARLEKEKREREKREAEADLKLSGVKVSKDTKVVSVGAAEFLRAVSSFSN